MQKPRTLTALALAASLTACSSAPKALANRLACTVDGSRAIVASMYGRNGLASYIDADDSAAVCRKAAPETQGSK